MHTNVAKLLALDLPQRDIKEVATNLEHCTQYWEENHLLCIAKEIASLIVDIQLSLRYCMSLSNLSVCITMILCRQPKQVISIIKDIKAQCHKITGHNSVEFLITNETVRPKPICCRSDIVL